jgi:hypothetical protein
MSLPKEFKISLADKPNLTKALQENPALAKEVIGTFVKLVEESFDGEKGFTWAELPKLLHKNLTFSDLIRGILRGSLDVKEMDRDMFDTFKHEVHPLSILSARPSDYDPTKLKASNWRNHFLVGRDAEVNEDTVAEIVRKMFAYTRWVPLDQWYEAFNTNAITAYRGKGDITVQSLPFIPALNYQQRHFNSLHVGKRLKDTGLFDCGVIPEEPDHCPSCKYPKEAFFSYDDLIGCYNCNAGFRIDPTVEGGK